MRGSRFVGRATALCAALVSAWLAIGCAGPATPSSEPDTVDVLEYLRGDASLWPRFGDQAQNQVIEEDRACWVKYTLPWMYECWRWDDEWIYHEVDHGIDSVRWVHYTFSDGRWLPRHLPRNGWSLDVAANQIRWVNAQCQPDAPRSFPYRVRAWLEPAYDAGGDLGVRETLVLEYAPYDPNNPSVGLAERFYMGRGAGWFQWTRSDGPRVRFNRVGGPTRQPAGLCNPDLAR